jgi:uncharacterized protein
MTTSFIDLTERGKNGWWRYVLGTGVVLFFWLMLGSLPLLAAAIWVVLDGNPATGIDLEAGFLTGINPIFSEYALLNLAFPLFLLGIFVAVRLVHSRRLRTLITPRSEVSLRRIWQGFRLWFVLAGVVTFIEYLLYPDAFAWAGIAPGRYVGFAMLALILTSLQAATEELFFRGYLLQGLGRRVRQPLVLAAINGLVFMLPHAFNPEVANGVVLTLLYYWGIGVFFAWLTLRDNRLELALGTHAANNLFVALFVNFKASVLQTPALILTDRLDPLYNLIGFVAMAGVFYVIVMRGNRLGIEGK